MHKLRKFLTLSVVIFFISSCVKEKYNLDHVEFDDYTPNVSLPLFHSSMSLKNIINDFGNTHLFEEEGQSFLKLVYESEVFSRKAEEIIIINNQHIPTETNNFNLPQNIPFNGYSETYNSSFVFQTNNNEKFDSLILKEGILTLMFNSNINYKSKLIVTIPGLTKNGVPFNQVIYDENTPFPPYIVKEIDLKDYKVIFDHSNGKNKLNLTYTLIAYNTTGQTNYSPYNINFSAEIRNIRFKKAFGNLGDITFELKKDTIYLDIFNNNLYTVKFHVIDPRIKMTIYNQIGIPLQIRINEAKAHSFRNPPYTIPISGTFQNPFPVEAPSINEIGTTKITTYVLNKNNSNLPQCVNISPYYYYLDVVGESNNSPDAQNFVIDTSRFRICTKAELPLWGEAWDFVIQDTLNFEFRDEIDKIEWITFYIKTINTFPIDAFTQVYFTDENYVILDSLLMFPGQRFIEAAPVGPEPDLRVTSPTSKLTTSTITKERLAKLKNTKKMLVRGYMATSKNGTQIVKIYSDYRLEVLMSVKIQFRIRHDQI